MVATSQNWKWSFCQQTTQCTTQRGVFRKRVLTCCLWLVCLYIKQHFIKIFIKKFCSFLYFYVNTFYLVLWYRYIRRIDMDNLKVYMFCSIFIFTCTQCNCIYILNITVLVHCTSCSDNFDPMSSWSSTSRKRFFTKNWIKRLPLLQNYFFAIK